MNSCGILRLPWSRRQNYARLSSLALSRAGFMSMPLTMRFCRPSMRRTGGSPCRIWCRPLTWTRVQATSWRVPDFNAGFTGSYDPTAETGRGPMFRKSAFGVPQFYPRDLKKRVDEYVVGQDRAKKTICSTLFNHYQNLRRRYQYEHEEKNIHEKLMRQRFLRDKEAQQRRETHPAEGQPVTRSHFQSGITDEFDQDGIPGHNAFAASSYETEHTHHHSLDLLYVPENTAKPHHVKIDKSNLLLVGPTGVGKTYILETLSKNIQVPFAICDCNSLTQAGYIGQDVESCIERLLIEANYDIKATERGIVVLDEFDKLARRESATGRDVGGEGVQQALLKLVEGTKVTINVKDSRSSRSTPSFTVNFSAPGPSSSSPQAAPPAGKVDQYTIDTTNILFIFCGAFVGLDKSVVHRVARPSIGFGGNVKGRSTLSGSKHRLPPEAYVHLAHHGSVPASSFTPLDLATPADLQNFGFIPEIIGRLHNICALSALSKDDMLRILTEPRNSLVAQYKALFETYPSRLYFTEKALDAIAERAAASETGARGLKMEMERVLAEPMFDAPTPYVLVTEGCVKGTEKASYWGKDGRFELDRRLEEEEINQNRPAPTQTFERLHEAGESGG